MCANGLAARLLGSTAAAFQIADLLLAGRLRTMRCAFIPARRLSAI
jgi:hypothetical protein